MKNLLIVCLAATGAVANAGTLFFDGILDGTSPTYNNSTGGGNNAYFAAMINVDVTGLYVVESASPNTDPTGGSNALDTYLRVFASSWTPGSGSGGSLASNDDFTGPFTVLPGPYIGTVLPNATGFTGAQPGSRLTVNLTANTDYWVVNTSFRTQSYVSTGTEGNGTGHFYTGIGGPGNVVPEPATFVAIGIGLAGLALARRRK